MKFNGACWRLLPIVLGVAIVSLGGCATGGSEPPVMACPPVPPYAADFQARAADELNALPSSSAIEAMLVDYAVMRAQARVCDTQPRIPATV